MSRAFLEPLYLNMFSLQHAYREENAKLKEENSHLKKTNEAMQSEV
jgi:hypothetical protein